MAVVVTVSWQQQRHQRYLPSICPSSVFKQHLWIHQKTQTVKTFQQQTDITFPGEQNSFPTNQKQVGRCYLFIFPGQEGEHWSPSNPLHVPNTDSTKKNWTMTHQEVFAVLMFVAFHSMAVPEWNEIILELKQPGDLGMSQVTCLLKGPLNPGVLELRSSFRIWVYILLGPSEKH